VLILQGASSVFYIRNRHICRFWCGLSSQANEEYLQRKSKNILSALKAPILIIPTHLWREPATQLHLLLAPIQTQCVPEQSSIPHERGQLGLHGRQLRHRSENIGNICQHQLGTCQLYHGIWPAMSEVMESNQQELSTTTSEASLQPLAWMRKAMKNISYNSKPVGWNLTWNGMQNTQSQSSISSQLLLFLSDQDKCLDKDTWWHQVLVLANDWCQFLLHRPVF